MRCTRTGAVSRLVQILMDQPALQLEDRAIVMLCQLFERTAHIE